jgi:hypothetical protein
LGFLDAPDLPAPARQWHRFSATWHYLALLGTFEVPAWEGSSKAVILNSRRDVSEGRRAGPSLIAVAMARMRKSQKTLLAQLAAQAETSTSAPDAERTEVAAALRRLHRVGLLQGVMRVLDTLGLHHLRKDWRRLYNARSNLFHGTVQLAEHEIAELATSAMTLCGRIILTLAERDGVTLPSVTDMHFPKALG